jgi:hypothetical protein
MVKRVPRLTKIPENPTEFNDYIQQNESITNIYTFIAWIIFIILMILLFRIAIK